jgi:hypothetical protein
MMPSFTSDLQNRERRLVDRRRHRRRVALHVLVVDHAGQHDGEGDIKDGADDERAHDAARDVALRVLRLLRGGRDRVEADIGEEDGARRRE